MTEIYITPLDMERIATFTQNGDFFEYSLPLDASYRDSDGSDPVWVAYVFRPDGTRRILKHRERGDCIFLRTDGCVLPMETRPLVCRLFPFEYTAEGLMSELSQRCLTQLLEPGKSLLESMQLSTSDAEVWHQQLYREIRLETNQY